MAPNKKKKKPVSNPARGFATTSVASKVRTQEIEDVDSEQKINDTSSISDVPKDDNKRSNGVSISCLEPDKQLHEMTPEELEAHLEESDLQAFLERHGEKTKRDASRQVARLKTEKRLLRSQAESLHTTKWLTPEVKVMLQTHIDSERPFDQKISITSNAPSLSSDDLLVQFWKIYLILLELGFSDTDTESALSHFSPGSLTHKTAKDGTWALDQTLDLLALSLANREGLEYDVHRVNPIRQDEDQSDKEFSGTPYVSVPNSGGISTPLSNLEVASEQSSNQSDAVISDLESDMEPDEMMDKYVSLQTRLYQIDSTFVVQAQKKGRQRSSTKPSQPNIPSTNPSIGRIQAQIQHITSDILFDKQQADLRWALQYVQLCQDTATRRRLDIIENNEIDTRKETAEKSSGAPEAEEPDIVLGDLFENLPEVSNNSTAGNSKAMTAINDGGKSIHIRSFGKFSGLAPRRVLEEACRARDPSIRFIFQVISETKFSYRHAVSFQWPRHQQSTFMSPFESVAVENQGYRRTRIEMVSISCPDSAQSEAYVATLALFIIFADSPKEARVHLRLPSVWRDLWAEMVQAKKDVDDASDRQVLRKLRYFVSQSEVAENDAAILDQHKSTAELKQILPEQKTTNVHISSDSLKIDWVSKISTPSYQAMLQSRKTLPIWRYQRDILDAIESHQVVIVCGATGCGKSTQVPAYILENELSNGRACKIYCTEPRRISAISLARRVSEELGEKKNDVGSSRSLVGFAIRLESQMTAQTRLVYATTGIVMRMLEGSRGLDGITHLLLDEVHERSIDSDFLLIILRKLLVRRPSLKVVLMSATVDAQKFSNYLGQAPVFEVPGRTYPVDARYLEDAIEITKYRLGDGNDAGIEAEDADQDEEAVISASGVPKVGHLANYSLQTRQTMSNINEYRVAYELIIKLLESIHTGHLAEYSKATLIFLPGIAEIRRLNDMLSGHPLFGRHCDVFALHSSISTEDQERAFLDPPAGKRKIVLATNIAETGITIPDITCVIDTGKHKEMRFDERRQLSRLIEAFISQANAVQRRGRAGRVQNGLCFHLFSKRRFEQMPLEQTPEMLRLSLQDLVLRVKICRLGSIEETLSEALDPPSAKNIRRAIDALQDVKALTLGHDLTALGKQLARLPLDVFLGKLLLLGAIHSCLDAALTIAAILSAKSPFTSTIVNRSQAEQAKFSFQRGDSDLLTVYNAYSAWRRVCNTKGVSEQQFCRKSCLSSLTLSNIEDLKGQLMNSLLDANFVTLTAEERSTFNKTRHHQHRRRAFVEVPPRYATNGTNDLIINSIIAMSFYPKLIKREGKGWRNVANNQTISLHPTSVNKRSSNTMQWLSFYHIMQSSNKFYNAHETSAVEDMAVALLCGEAEVKMYAGVIVIDGNRIRFSVRDWGAMLMLKILRVEMRAMVEQQIKHPGRPLSEREQQMLEIWQKMFTREDQPNTG